MRKLIGKGGLGAALLLLVLPGVKAATALGDGDRVEMTFGPGDANLDYYVAVPEGTTHLSLLLEANRVEQDDVDLFLRFGETFSAENNPLSQADYRSLGETGLEHIEVTFASSPPVSPGRWYLALVNAGGEATGNVTLTIDLKSETDPSLKPVDISVAYTDEPNTGFLDNSPFEGHGNNDATTLGEARRTAFEKAIEMLENSLTSPVTVMVEAQWEDLGGNGDDGNTTLAQAGPRLAFANFPGARKADTFYPGSTVPRLAGTDVCRMSLEHNCSQPAADLFIKFNTEAEWWYGIERDFGSNGSDFVAVAVHEMLHGLGFLSLADVETGELFHGLTDAYTDELVWKTGDELLGISDLTDAQRRQAFTGGGFNLNWGGEKGQEFWDENFPSCLGCPRPTIYAPREVNPGSSVSHTNFPDIMHYLADRPTNDPDIDIRTGGRKLGAAWYFLRDAGWDEDPKQKLEGPADPEVPRGMWYDRSRNGHGFDFQRVGNLWFLVFFTYNDQGNPVWYLAVGSLEDNVFTGPLQRFTYDETKPVDGGRLTAEDVGTVELAFEATPETPACDDDVNRDDAIALARFSWTIEGQDGEWCAEPLPLPGTPPAPDFTGHWYAGEMDTGWGMTIYQRQREDGTQLLLDTLYFFDAEGHPRWAQGFTGEFVNSHGDQTITMQQFDGFPRGDTCQGEGCVAGSDAGVIRLKLAEPLQGNDAASKATTNVDYLGMEAGTWRRNFVTIQMLSDPS